MKRFVLPVWDTAKFFISKRGALLYALFFLLVLGSTFYLAFGRGAVESLIDQTLERELVAVEFGAGAVENFFMLTSNSLVVLADDPRIERSKNPQEALDDFIENWRGTPLIEVNYVDEMGVVRYVSNALDTRDAGTDVSDRRYFIRAKSAGEGEVYIGEAVVARYGVIEGKYLVPMAAPVVGADGDFRGAITAAIYLEDFVNSYINTIRITEDSKVYLISRKGEVVYGPDEVEIGGNIRTFLKESPFIGSEEVEERVLQVLETSESGTYDIVAPESFPQKSRLVRNLVAYSPVEVGGERWVLALRLSVDEALKFVTPFYSRQVVGFVIIFLSLLILSVRMSKIEGFREALEEEKKAKK